jgi:transcriptional regulator with XRE-family HTH domain
MRKTISFYEVAKISYFAKVVNRGVLMSESLIAKKRTELKLSQQELADIAGVSLHTVFRAEKGNNVNTASIQAIATALKTSVGYLTGETDDPSPPYRASETDDTPFMRLERKILEETRLLEKMSHAELTGEPIDGFLGPSPPGHPKGESGDPPTMPDSHSSSQTEQSKSRQEEVVSNVAPINPAHMIRVRILDKTYKACCGNGIDWGPEAVEFESSILMQAPELAQRYSDDDIIGVYADGDSMERNIFDGDLVLFAWREKAVSYAGILMVVSYNNRILVRGVVENNRKMLTLKPHNKEYGDIIVTPDDDFDICGRVVDIHARRKPMPVM